MSRIQEFGTGLRVYGFTVLHGVTMANWPTVSGATAEHRMGICGFLCPHALRNITLLIKHRNYSH